MGLLIAFSLQLFSWRRIWPQRHAFTARSSSLGFTMLELLVVLGIISILAVLTGRTFSTYAFRQQFQRDVVTVERSIIEQRSKTLASLQNSSYGIYVASTSLVLFEGTTYSASDPTNEIVYFLGTVATTSFSNGLSELWFAKITGTPSATGTITLLNKKANSSTTISLYASGLIE